MPEAASPGTTRAGAADSPQAAYYLRRACFAYLLAVVISRAVLTRDIPDGRRCCAARDGEISAEIRGTIELHTAYRGRDVDERARDRSAV